MSIGSTSDGQISFATTPLIWTKHGNLPVHLLDYVPIWTETPDGVQFVEEYFYESELVRRNVHNYSRSI